MITRLTTPATDSITTAMALWMRAILAGVARVRPWGLACVKWELKTVSRASFNAPPTRRKMNCVMASTMTVMSRPMKEISARAESARLANPVVAPSEADYATMGTSYVRLTNLRSTRPATKRMTTATDSSMSV